MGSIFEKFRQFNKIQGGDHVNKSIASTKIEAPEIIVLADDPALDLELELTAPENPRVHVDDLAENVQARIRVLQEKEAHLRNQREKYRMNYYTLARKKAPQEDFKKNYAIIAQLTKDLAPVYIERLKIQTTGQVETVIELTSEQELEIHKLKNQKRKLIDKKSKLSSKIANYLGFANGQKNLHIWEKQFAETELTIYEIDEEINRIEGCQN